MRHASSRIAFAGLWLGWFTCLPVTFAVTLLTGNTRGTRLWWVSSALLALAAWIHWLLHRSDSFGAFAGLIAGGMTFGLLADLYGFFEAIRFTEALPMIILLFALGHLCYIGGMLVIARHRQWMRHPHWKQVSAAMIVVYSLIAAALWLTLVHPSEDWPNLHAATAVYTLLLALSAAAMMSGGLLDRRFRVMGLGGLLFLISDAFLAVRLFQDNRYGIGDLCWITYGCGQMLIVYGAILAAWIWEHDHESKTPME